MSHDLCYKSGLPFICKLGLMSRVVSVSRDTIQLQSTKAAKIIRHDVINFKHCTLLNWPIGFFPVGNAGLTWVWLVRTWRLLQIASIQLVAAYHGLGGNLFKGTVSHARLIPDCLPTYLPAYLPACLCVRLSTCLSTYASDYLSPWFSVYLHVCMFDYLPVCLSVCLSVCIPIRCLYACLYVCLRA